MAARLTQAMTGSKLATARLQGMKIRAKASPAIPAAGAFPYPHRTCAEWEEVKGRFGEKEMSQNARRRDAKRGSAKLRDALRRVA